MPGCRLNTNAPPERIWASNDRFSGISSNNCSAACEPDVGPADTGITVNGITAFVEDGRFVANHVPLETGENLITATATVTNGFEATHTISVTSTGEEPVLTLEAEPTTGLAPLTVTFEYRFTLTRAVQSVAYDFDGDDVDDFTSTGPVPSVQNTYTTPGLYLVRLTLIDDQNETHEATVGVEVLDEAGMTSLFVAIWNDMNSALVAGDVSGALQRVAKNSREKYQPAFETLLPQMADIVGGYSPLDESSISPSIAQFAVRQTVDGEDFIFFVLFIRDDDGVWRISSM